jgi:preprotein translocase subunit SecE
MGRLQKKKISTKNKPKKNHEKDELPSEKSVSVLSKSVFLKDTLKDKEKFKTQPEKKSLSISRKSEPGKLQLYMEQGIQFLREVKVELKKVVWPSRKQTMGSTAVVIVLVLIISFFLGVVDFGLQSFIRVILQ